MVRALNTAASGMNAQQVQIDVIANNLANVNTPGFKKARAEFQDMYYQQLRAATQAEAGGTSAPIGLEVGQGVRVMASQKIFSGGELLQTNGKLDLAIEGRGFFQVVTADGSMAYTRAGQFRVNEQGQMVNMDGYVLDPQITLPPDATEVQISREGVVQIKQSGDNDFTNAGELRLAVFQNPAGLQSEGRGLYSATMASGQPMIGVPGRDGVGGLAQGQLESSNVKVVEEMIDLISAQRAYEINSKVVQATDEMLRNASNLR
jgi:flagellar basal-body rod protein FlgG